MSDAIGPWAVIAGGSEGIGAAFADELAARGLNLVLIARNPDKLDELKTELAQKFPTVSVRTLAVDLSSSDAVDIIARNTTDIEVGTLVYNVGSESVFDDFLDQSLDHLNGRLLRNVTVKVGLVHHFASLMRPRKKGSIILMGSQSGYYGAAGFAIYCATKAFSRYLSEALWYEFKQDNINLLCPAAGPTDTPTMRRAYGEFRGTPADPAWIARMSLDHIDKGPIWVADDIAERVAVMNALPPRERAERAAESAAAFAKRSKAPA
ncbi:MAG: short-chain dehydrogenase [Acidobacteria bacterium]|nr:short-chain dehydrogenase [Acidobacteriota bacterium]|tara:strand:+ start:1422 stop:2216 length:795 start_codon:yes stop_codon:yes gene_type:complete